MRYKSFGTALTASFVVGIIVMLGVGAYLVKGVLNSQDKETIVDSEVSEAPEEMESWQTYTNDEFSYAVSYPSDWYFKNQGYNPPPPAMIMLSTKPDGDEAYPYASVQVLAVENPEINDVNNHPEVISLVEDGYKKESTKVDGIDAVKISSSDTTSKSVSYYFKKGNIVYRIGYQYPVGEPGYLVTCEDIVDSFTMIN